MSDNQRARSPSDLYETVGQQTNASDAGAGASDDEATIRTRQSPPLQESTSRAATRTPISPSPQRTVPTEIRGIRRDIPPHMSITGQDEATTTRSLSAAPPTDQPATPTSASSPPAVRFESLEGRIPDEQIQSLRVFVSHLGLQNQKLRLTGDHLSNLGSEVHELREHAGSLNRRIDRATSDNARFLVESEGHISELSRIFDTPRGQVSAAISMAPEYGVVDATGTITQLSTAPILRSESGVYQSARDEEIERRATNDSVSQARAMQEPRGDNVSDTSTSHQSGRPASSRSSLPPRGPGETSEQYDARYEANIRRVNHTQGSWSRAYDPGPPRQAGHPHPMTRDARFEPATEQHAPARDTGFEDLRPAGARANTPNHVVFESISRPLNPYAGITAPPIGISAYRVTQGPVTNGIWHNDHYHYVVLLGRVAQIIKFKVGDPFEIPSGFKQPKLHEPSKYAGSHSHDEFMDWLSEFLNWLRGHYICGPATDSVRIIYLGLSITGPASDWFTTEIDNPSRKYDPPLLFSDCVCLMHKRFVRTATANDAAVKYNAVRYSTTDGVEGLYYKLDRSAERMIERPNEYDFRRRLFNLLPHWLHDKLRDRNIIPEYASLEDIRENARQLEENALRTYEGVEDSPTRRDANAVARVPRNPRPTRSNPPARIVPAAEIGRTSAPREARPLAARPNAGPRLTNRDRPVRDKSGMTCYGCGKLGHISSDPTCENYDANRARLHMQHEVDDDEIPPDDDPRDEDSPDELAPPSWGGSQYDSAEEEFEDNTEAEPHARVAAMYTVRLAAMRVIDEDALDEEAAEMPALEECSDEDSEDDERPPHSMLSDRGHPIPSRTLRTRFVSDLRARPETVISSVVIGNRQAALNMPNYGMSSMGIEDSVTRIWASGSLNDWDNGPSFDAFSAPSPLQVPPPHVRRSSERTTPPSEHLPNYAMVRAVSVSVWMDTRERILEFTEREHLDEYNRCISRLVMCWACGNRCRPTVFQRLARLPLGINPGTYLTTYICHFAGRPEGEATSIDPPPLIGEDTDSEDDSDPEAGGYADGDSYVDGGEEEYGPLGEYSSSLYAMRLEHSSNIRRPTPPSGPISRPRHNQSTISCMITINGHEALALFDSGSTTDSITPEFGFASRTRQFKLDEQITLQLGCVGSRSKIVYGAVAPVTITGITEEMYFDVVNIDKYDAILGTPFLQRHGILLDFKRGGVIANDKFFKSFSLSEELAFIAQKKGGKDERTRGPRAAPRDTAPIRVATKLTN
ncbi:hypothetical protein HWV62_42444 [Athelia sp. TMB]|nr:hypothetical protein HWV62_42444 [Athelia sp. TMB]